MRNNPLMSNPKKPNVTSRKIKQLNVLARRPLVKLYLQLEGWGPTQIAREINKTKNTNVTRKTVADDIQIIIAEVEMWERNQALVGWLSQVKTMTENIIKEIEYLESKLVWHKKWEQYGMIPKKLRTEQEKTFELKLSYHKLNLGSIMSLSYHLDQKRITLAELKERSHLYSTTQKYAKFFVEHQQQELT